MKFGGPYLKRIQKLELTIRVPPPESRQLAIRLEAMDKLDHTDRMRIIHLMRRSANGQALEITPEVEAAVARWRETIKQLMSERGWARA